MVSPTSHSKIGSNKYLVVESFGPPEKPSSPQMTVSEATQKLFAKKAQTNIIDELITSISIEAFIEDVVKVEKRLNRGHITNVRELELELMCAGKVSKITCAGLAAVNTTQLASQSEMAYNRFLTHVMTLCDPLYEIPPPHSRRQYHIQDITLVKQLIPEETYNDHFAQEDPHFDLEMEDDLPLAFQLNVLEHCDDKARDNLNSFMRDVSGSLAHDRYAFSRFTWL
jgi:hypothetical protein